MNPSDALSVTETLLSVLEAAVRSAEAETEALKRWDKAEVIASTSQREAFTAEGADLSARLQAALSKERTRTPRLQAKLKQLEALAAKLKSRDSVNRELARRVLAFTQAYFNAILPRAQAYDRRGQSTPNVSPPSTISQRL